MITTPPADAWPSEFIRRMRSWLGDEADAFFTALAQRDVGLRLNPLRGPLEDLKARLPWETQPVPWCPEGVWLQEEAPAGAHLYHTLGVYYVQDPSAMAAGVLLDPHPGEWVLDLAAAPGGKTTHIATRMHGEGVLVANEVVRRRATVLAMNIERMGVTNALVINETPERLAARWAGLFDAVLVDAPCSGEGTFARDSQAIRDWSVDTVSGNARRQKQILDQTAPLVQRGGRLLYGTCTFAPEENESVIADFLTRHPDFAIADLPALPGLQPGHPEWVGAPDALQRAGRFWPHTGPGHGHFYALLRRQGEPPNDLPERWTGSAIPGRIWNLYQKTVGAALVMPVSDKGLLLTPTDDLYITPLEPKLWDGLHVLRPGWWVASLRHNKVWPDHALALALRPEDVRDIVNLAQDDPRLENYLQGGFWPDHGSPGYVLVAVDGFPVGWAKRGEGRLRSRYPLHLRG
ncbi:MAG TPA: RsmF rRNA methyltransferase first C-terminal domain-containing protein [Anaerolineae bacterium]|nr:RsmF rRNA methyltransferase first C-terminal domain-containing protein [Anaerolineae bacterium]HQH39707.1 RsmF rRNA methyltransferase first C-terminal domain-containing protein [Anaerolineae bacterium]